MIFCRDPRSIGTYSYLTLSTSKLRKLSNDDKPEKAPSLKKFGGTHLEADEYHRAMEDPDAVVIDVRNAYESSIGGFRPPEGGAELIDPKMRNSIEFPKWLNSDETRERINGKKVLMYCSECRMSVVFSPAKCVRLRS